MNLELEEVDRQLVLRALAVQSLESPGFEHASRNIAKILQGEVSFDHLRRQLEDVVKPRPRTCG